jgi:hypothetical protein
VLLILELLNKSENDEKNDLIFEKKVLIAENTFSVVDYGAATSSGA